MRRNTLIVDLALAVVAMIVLVIISPGLAIVGLIAILVLVVCALSFVFDAWRTRRHGRRGPPPRRSAPAPRPARRPARRL
jgi:ABC-type bacteriocin/lantibiotic exporter with double-glycine peptidase domain